MTTAAGESSEPFPSADDKASTRSTGDVLADELSSSPPQQGAFKDSARETIASLKAAAGSAKDAASAAAQSARSTGDQWRAQCSSAGEQALETARYAATTAKEKAGSALQSLSKLMSDTAGTIDERVGPDYGQYARTAARSVADVADNLNAKDVDQLVADAREFVRKQPAVAIGAAAVLGFVMMRLLKGSDSKDEEEEA